MSIIKDELSEIKNSHGDERKSIIEFSGGELSIEDMIPDEKVVLTISHAGYIKRTSLSEYKTQNREVLVKGDQQQEVKTFLSIFLWVLIINICYSLLKKENAFG